MVGLRHADHLPPLHLQLLPQLCHRLQVTLLRYRIRFFQIFGVEIRKDIDWKEVVFIVSVVALALAFFLSNVQLQTMIKIDGAIVVSSLSIIFPVVMHLKCVLADRSSG